MAESDRVNDRAAELGLDGLERMAAGLLQEEHWYRNTRLQKLTNYHGPPPDGTTNWETKGFRIRPKERAPVVPDRGPVLGRYPRKDQAAARLRST